MNKLKTAKGSLKDHYRFLDDEIDDYAEQPDNYDPISHLLHHINTSQSQTEFYPRKPRTSKKFVKRTCRWPKFKPDFNLEAICGEIFETLFIEKLASFLDVSDAARLLRTCSYLYKVFSKAAIWFNYIKENFGSLNVYLTPLSSTNMMQYAKYLRFSKHEYLTFYTTSDRIEKNNDGIVFDSVIIEREMKSKEEQKLIRNVVDFVTVKSQKTVDTINKLVVKGTLTGDIKISWIKEMNQVCVWVAGYQVQNEGLQTFAGVLLRKNYEEESQVIKKVYFLNDRYFVIETEKRSEDNGSVVNYFEVCAIEPEDDWFERIQLTFCKQILKESFVGKNSKVKTVGDFIVFVSEREDDTFSVQAFDANGQYLFESKGLRLDSGLYDVSASKAVTKSFFSLYLLDKELDVYRLSYSHESGVSLKKFYLLKKDREEEEQNDFQNQVKKYHYGTYTIVDEKAQRKTLEYLMVYKKRRFYFVNCDSNELISCDLPQKGDKDSELLNWTICGDYLHLLLDSTMKTYLLNFKNYSGILNRIDLVDKVVFQGGTERWVLVNPCLKILVSAGSFVEGLTGSVQLLIGSTQRLLVKRDWSYMEVHFDECQLDKMLEGMDSIECKFEDERLLIRTGVRSYFRDFNVCERRVEKRKYKWKMQTRYDLDELSIVSIEPAKEYRGNIEICVLPMEEKSQAGGEIKENKKRIFRKEFFFENKNHEKLIQKANQNWKSIEKKDVDEEKLEKKESRKKGDKYYKNVRQNKHRQKLFD